ncbi:hypothetical protein ABNF73_23085, partial [Paenibacillus larvae]
EDRCAGAREPEIQLVFIFLNCFRFPFGGPRFINEKTEHERIKKEKAALELAVMKGELHRAEDVRAEMADRVSAVLG